MRLSDWGDMVILCVGGILDIIRKWKVSVKQLIYIYIYIKPKLLKLPQFFTSALFLKKKF